MNRERVQTTVRETAYFLHLCDSAGVAFLAVDCHLNVRYCNQQAAELLGKSIEGIIGSSIGQIVRPEERGLAERLANRAIQRGQCGRYEFRYVDRAGGNRYLAATVSPIRDGEGRTLGASACIRDITRCIQRQEQLGRMQKMRALGTMAGNFAHHFNNILGGVVTSVDFAKQSNDVRVLKKTLQAAAGSLQRATRLLDELLAFAEADYRETDLADLTETVLHFVDRIKPVLNERGIEFDLKLSQVPVLEIPRSHFLTILNNLANNALDAMSDGGRFAMELETDSDQVVCRIVDTGRGIVREDLEHVFEPFYSTKSQQAGAGQNQHPGLGLSVVVGMVHEMGGDITIASEPGRPTVVEIRLPLNPDKPVRPHLSSFSATFAYSAVNEPT